jgi:hypothetical protein
MSTTEQPPGEVFCMTCGPEAVLDRDPAAPVFRCSSCGAVTDVPALPLFVVTGASGAGKTSVTAPLGRLLPASCWDPSTFATSVDELAECIAAWIRPRIP